jgi:hypothetical protein
MEEQPHVETKPKKYGRLTRRTLVRSFYRLGRYGVR